MDGVQQIKQLITQKDFATSLDLHQAFHHIRVSTEFQPYLGFRFEKKDYIYQGMPFEVATAPRIFTKTHKLAMMEVRRRWKSRILAYADDITVTELGLVNVETRDSGNQELLNEAGMANSGGQESNRTKSGVRVSGLALENKGNDLLANSGQEKMHDQGVKINDQQSQEYRKDPSKKTSKFNWRNPIYRSIVETRASTHKVT
ncbi:MAG: hypothetical protein EZS28_053561 [Streblomastix strix]|uniref:Reverse transcriptase domain-containing protein n=1 Tax=Streblomastix strix TaxID=222440 RepID=A0A5J4RAB0_9EUKA|nr:MAG: hypothetical protein EZS28_053561 [Streblomastix strix]